MDDYLIAKLRDLEDCGKGIKRRLGTIAILLLLILLTMWFHGCFSDL